VELTVDPNNGNQLNLKKHSSISLFWFGGLVTEKLHTSALKRTKKSPGRNEKETRETAAILGNLCKLLLQSSHLTMVEKVSIMRSINQQGVPALGE